MVKDMEKPTRELYVQEREQIQKTNTKQIIDAFWNKAQKMSREEVKTYKKGRFLELLYSENKPARRYFANPNILGWNIFSTFKTAKEKGYTTYEQYISYIKTNIDNTIITRVILSMAYSLLTYKEVQRLHEDNKWNEWVEDIMVYYINSFITTVWEGKQKEITAMAIVKKELEKWAGLRIVKTSEEKDQTYMIDAVILNQNNDPVLGISIKGASWYWASKATSATTGAKYYAKGEVREHKGHKAFSEAYNAPVIVVVSEIDETQSLLWVLPTVREALIKLETQGKIEKKTL